ARRWRVAQITVLGADDRRHDLADAGAAVAAEPGDWRLRALHPRAADEAHTGEAEVHLRVGDRRRHDRDPQRLDLPQVGIADAQRVAAERDAVQAPPG